MATIYSSQDSIKSGFRSDLMCLRLTLDVRDVSDESYYMDCFKEKYLCSSTSLLSVYWPTRIQFWQNENILTNDKQLLKQREWPTNYGEAKRQLNPYNAHPPAHTPHSMMGGVAGAFMSSIPDFSFPG